MNLKILALVPWAETSNIEDNDPNELSHLLEEERVENSADTSGSAAGKHRLPGSATTQKTHTTGDKTLVLFVGMHGKSGKEKGEFGLNQAKKYQLL